MNRLILLPLAAATLLTGCETYDTYGSGDRSGDYGYYDRDFYSQYGSYDWDHPDPRYGGYYPDNYYRDDQRYRERVLSRDDRIYRGRNGNYYCRRSDGTTGLVVGAFAGGIAGNIIAPGDSKTLGTILGAMGGAAIGGAADSGQVHCR